MWKLPKGEDFLPNTSLNQLEDLYTTETRAKPKIRLLCAIHRKKGASLDDIAQVTALNRATVHSILRRFQQRGINGKDAIKQTGRPAFLTLQQRKTLFKKLEKGPPNNKTGLWSTKEVQEYIKQQCGVEYTNVHIWELLKALGFSLQKPRPRHHKQPDSDELERFKKKLPGWRAIIDQEAG
jgi:transposase